MALGRSSRDDRFDTHDVSLLTTLVAGFRLGFGSALLRDVPLHTTVIATKVERTDRTCSEGTHHVGVPAFGQLAAWWPTADWVSMGEEARRAKILTAAAIEASAGRHRF